MIEGISVYDIIGNSDHPSLHKLTPFALNITDHVIAYPKL